MNPEQFAEKIKAKYPQYANVDALTLTNKIIEKYPQYKSQVVLPEQPKENLGTKIVDKLKQRNENIKEIVKAKESGTQGALESAYQTAGEVAGGIVDVPIVAATEVVKPAIKTGGEVLNFLFGDNPIYKATKTAVGAGVENISKAKEAVVENVSDIPVVQEFAQTEGSKRLERNVKATNELVNLIPAPRAAKLATEVAVDATKGALNVADDLVKNLVTTSEKSIESKIVNKFEKGVKPSLASQGTPAKATKYKEDIVEAVKTIDSKKSNLSFTDEAGEVVTGRNPKTLQEMTDAVEQTKKSVFNEYDSLAKQAGEAGVGVEMTPIASELDSVISNKALSVTSPQTIEYAKQLKDRLVQVGKVDASTAQEIIQNYNKSLEAFYRNPSYENASRAGIDALIANQMRKVLDEGISGLTGKAYQALKKQYGALKAIEKDVVRATARDARKNVKGLIDFSDVLSGGQLVSGILSLNPALIASGITQKSIAQYIKFLNNPNRAIESMFKAVEKIPR